MSRCFSRAKVYAQDGDGRVLAIRYGDGEPIFADEPLEACEHFILPDRKSVLGCDCFIACEKSAALEWLDPIGPHFGERCLPMESAASENEARKRALEDSEVFSICLSVGDIAEYAENVMESISSRDILDAPDILGQLRGPFREGDEPAAAMARQGMDEASPFLFENDLIRFGDGKPKP